MPKNDFDLSVINELGYLKVKYDRISSIRFVLFVLNNFICIMTMPLHRLINLALADRSTLMESHALVAVFTLLLYSNAHVWALALGAMNVGGARQVMNACCHCEYVMLALLLYILNGLLGLTSNY